MSSQSNLPRVEPVLLTPMDIIELPTGSSAEEVFSALERFIRNDGKPSGAQVYAVMVYDPRFMRDVPVVRIQMPVDLT